MKDGVYSKSAFLIYVISIFVMSYANAQTTKKADLSGSWKINAAKSDFGKAPLFVMLSAIEIIQKADSIYLKGSGTAEDGAPYSVPIASYTLNGTTVEHTFKDGSKVAGFTLMKAGENVMEKNQKYFNPDKPESPTRIVKEIWSISDDGKTLTISQNVDIPPTSVKYAIKAVYDKI